MWRKPVETRRHPLDGHPPTCCRRYPPVLERLIYKLSMAKRERYAGYKTFIEQGMDDEIGQF